MFILCSHSGFTFFVAFSYCLGFILTMYYNCQLFIDLHLALVYSRNFIDLYFVLCFYHMVSTFQGNGNQIETLSRLCVNDLGTLGWICLCFVVLQLQTEILTRACFSKFNHVSNPKLTLIYDCHVGWKLDHFLY